MCPTILTEITFILIAWAIREVFNDITCLNQLGITTHANKSKNENKQAL